MPCQSPSLHSLCRQYNGILFCMQELSSFVGYKTNLFLPQEILECLVNLVGHNAPAAAAGGHDALHNQLNSHIKTYAHTPLANFYGKCKHSFTKGHQISMYFNHPVRPYVKCKVFMCISMPFKHTWGSRGKKVD